MQHGKWRFGISPINWVNEDIPELGDHFTFEQLMADFQSLGFTGTEMSRKFPSDPRELKAKLAAHGIELVSQWKGVSFSVADAGTDHRKQQLDDYRRHVEFLHEMGSRCVVTCEIAGSPHADPAYAEAGGRVRRLDEEGWKRLVDGLNEAGHICRERGMHLVYHFHAGTVIERGEEIDRLLEETDPALVHLLFDSGHALYGGTDPLNLLKKHGERVRHVHLKDVRPDVLARVQSGEIGFLEAVKAGVFTVPGDGCIDFAPIFIELERFDYEGWMIIEAEQDPSLAPPLAYAQKAVEYLKQTLPRRA